MTFRSSASCFCRPASGLRLRSVRYRLVPLRYLGRLGPQKNKKCPQFGLGPLATRRKTGSVPNRAETDAARSESNHLVAVGRCRCLHKCLIAWRTGTESREQLGRQSCRQSGPQSAGQWGRQRSGQRRGQRSELRRRQRGPRFRRQWSRQSRPQRSEPRGPQRRVQRGGQSRPQRTMLSCPQS